MTDQTVWTYSEKDKALGHKMRAKTSLTDECVYCGAMINDCNNWPGRTGGTIFEACKLAPFNPVLTGQDRTTSGAIGQP